MDDNLVIMEGSMLSTCLLLQWMVALSLWNIVCCRYFFTPMDASLVNMEGSLLLIFLLLQWMVALSLCKVVSSLDFYNDKVTINWNNKNLDNRLPSIMTGLPSIGVPKI